VSEVSTKFGRMGPTFSSPTVPLTLPPVPAAGYGLSYLRTSGGHNSLIGQILIYFYNVTASQAFTRQTMLHFRSRFKTFNATNDLYRFETGFYSLPIFSGDTVIKK
jgi:hypothetical protein